MVHFASNHIPILARQAIIIVRDCVSACYILSHLARRDVHKDNHLCGNWSTHSIHLLSSLTIPFTMLVGTPVVACRCSVLVFS